MDDLKFYLYMTVVALIGAMISVKSNLGYFWVAWDFALFGWLLRIVFDEFKEFVLNTYFPETQIEDHSTLMTPVGPETSPPAPQKPPEDFY